MPGKRERLFDILVREHELGLSAFVRSCVFDRAATDDLVQETFVTAWKRLDDYDENTPFARWLRGIAKNKVLAHLRTSATAGRHLRLLDPKALALIADQFDHLIAGRGDTMSDTLSALKECLQTLKPADSEIVRRTYHRSQTCRHIADQLGHTVEAIKKRLQRARAQLRDCIVRKLEREAARG